MLHSNPFAAAYSRWYPKILKRNLQPVHRWIAVHKNINYCRQNKKVELPVFYNPSYNLFCRRMRIQKFALFLSEIDEITIPNPVLYRQYVIFYCICKRYFPPIFIIKMPDSAVNLFCPGQHCSVSIRSAHPHIIHPNATLAGSLSACCAVYSGIYRFPHL